MKKMISNLLIILLIFISVFSANAQNSNKEDQIFILEKDTTISFSEMSFQIQEEYLNIEFEEANSYLTDPGKPMIPEYTKTIDLPINAKIQEIDIGFSNVEEIPLTKEIRPAPKPVSLIDIDKSKKNSYVKNLEIYDSENIYPEKNYDYDIRVGVKDREQVIYVNLRLYPVQYSPKQNIVYYSKDADVKVKYVIEELQEKSSEKYDMVIIAPSIFSFKLQPLIKHKNEMGVKTVFKTTESIYLESLAGKYDARGRDKAEQIKYFIKYALDNWDITYVLIVGGLKGQRIGVEKIDDYSIKTKEKNWYVPVRYSNNWGEDEYPPWELGYITDLYFSDIYGYNEITENIEFEDWDSNNNNIFAEFRYMSDDNVHYYLVQDDIDYSPDVFVGRLPCRNKRQVESVVDKIIDYEKTTYGQEWFKIISLIAGDTFTANGDDILPGFYEGEINTNVTANYIENKSFLIKKLWASEGNLTGIEDIENQFKQGCGFVHITGHANPFMWVTYPPDNETVCASVSNLDMDFFDNNEKLPIVVVGGCHNSQIDVSLANIIRDIKEYGFSNYFNNRFYYMEWITNCWSWHLTKISDGGSIATIGCTGLGLEYINDDSTIGLLGWLEPRFFHAYAIQNKENLGEVHSQAITDYINFLDIKDYYSDIKTIEEWMLIGDPSLKIGGYP